MYNILHTPRVDQHHSKFCKLPTKHGFWQIRLSQFAYLDNF